MLKPTVEEIRAQMTVTTCSHCGFEGIDKEEIKAYDHDNGWQLFGHSKRQWLWVDCPGCKYEWALWKLGVGTKWNDLRGGEINE